MKRIVNILASIFLIASAFTCDGPLGSEGGITKPGKDKNKHLQEKMLGEWQLIEMSSYSTLPVDVYIIFNEDGTFDLFQKVGDVARYSKLSGIYTLTGSILTGEYNDGEELASAYRLSLEEDVLVMTAVVLDAEGAIVVDDIETLKYTKASLSQEEKNDANVITKSTDSELFYVL